MDMETGTFLELGPQPGDVVECVSDWGNSNYTNGKHYLVNEDGLIENDRGSNKIGARSVFRIVSRCAQVREEKGPVRTVTRKEILPGVYGRIAVCENDYKHSVLIRLADAGGEYDEKETGHYFSTDQLTAAIATLTEIRDALEQNQ